MKKLIIFSFAFGLLVSCKKDDVKTCSLNMTSLAGTYKVTAVRYKATPSGSETDYFNLFYADPCERDDKYIFNADSTYIFTDAGVQCSPPGDDTGTWSLSGNTVTVDGGPANVDSFSCTALTVSVSDAISAGDKLILVFTRQ